MQLLIDRFIEEWESDSPYIEAHTSGSTGEPKPIRLLKTDMIQSAEATNSFFGINSRSRLHLALSPHYIAGKMMIVRSIVAGCHLSAEQPSNHHLLGHAPDSIDLLAVVPSQCAQLVDNPDACHKLRNVIVGGAPMSPELEHRLLGAPWKTYATYGMTETCSHVALRPIGQEEYHAMPGITFATDRRGCLTVNAPCFSFHSLQTNDIVELTSPTTFVWLCRADNVINSGGLKLYPEQIERMLQPHIPYPFVIQGISHPVWGTATELLVERPDISADENICATIEQLQAICTRNLPSHLRPKSIRLTPSLPRTANGKIKRHNRL